MKFKVLFFLFCSFFLQFSYSQETENKSPVKFNHDFRINALIPSNYGDNFLAKANDAKLGIGMNFSFLRIYDFKLGIGYDYIPYSSTDISMTGNIKNADYQTVYGDVAYEIKITDKLNIEPYFGFGGLELKFRSDARDFGNQTGSNFRIGFNTDYKLAKRLSGFIGICYLGSKLDISTSPEFVSFYHNAKMFQFNIGLKIH
ncbi:hypothetical protein [Flavobacterium daemonense]|uniref:hypothetical protein n=1 Tax=Flavobacterium daemonense TaxID=1393049 RepID=UPI001184E51D|nr:hypothetical protein [Flavobacterium daemonense]KAF2331368.1 hypothetical protein FND99_14070 [Flavobacterium daemonense]